MLLKWVKKTHLIFLAAMTLSSLALPGCCLLYDQSYRLPGTREFEPDAEYYAMAAEGTAYVAQEQYDIATYAAKAADTAAKQAQTADTDAAAAQAVEAAWAAANQAAEAADAAKRLTTRPQPAPKPKSFLGIRYDKSDEQRLRGREACPPPDPCTVPSYSELRKAKADAAAAQEIKAKGGDISIRPDGSSSNPTEIKFVAAPGALAMSLTASDNLNAIDGLPHALVLVIYQLSDRTFFDQLAGTTDGVRKLLAMEATDPSVKAVRQMFIQPGMKNTLALDRAEDGRYVALVAGYNRTEPTSSVFVTTYRIGQYTQKKGALQKSQEMFRPLPLNLAVNLGPAAMAVSETDDIMNNLQNAQRVSYSQ